MRSGIRQVLSEAQKQEYETMVRESDEQRQRQEKEKMR
jgi:hypothetical protein